MPNRQRKGKLKREHSMLPGLEVVLAEICAWPETTACIPARIRRTGKPRKGALLTVQARTPTGLKTAAHASGAVQEVFIVTGNPHAVEQKILSAPWGARGGA